MALEMYTHIEYENQHVGSVKISMSSASIIEILSELHVNQDYYFVIDKDVVEENLFIKNAKMD